LSRPRQRWVRQLVQRRLVGAAVVVALLITMTGSGALPQQRLALRLVLPGDSAFAVTDDTLYLVPASRDPALTAYRLDKGAVRWERQVRAAPGEHVAFTVEDNVPIALFYVPHEDGARVVAYHPDTGRQLWSRTGSARERAGAGRLLLEADTLRVLELATGRTLWTHESVWRDYLVDQDRLFVLGIDDHLTAYDVETGEPLATVATNPVGETPILVPAGPLVTVLGETRVFAYDAASLAYRWSASLAGTVSGCGPMVCVSTANDAYTLDPATGEPAWTVDWAREHPSQRISIQQLGPLRPAGGVLMLEREPFTDEWRSWLVDARTGETVLDLRGWHRQPTELDPDGASMAEPVLSQYRDGATWFGRLRADRSGVEVLGKLDGPERACVFRARHAVCLADPYDRDSAESMAELELWELRTR
jgi:outer membrane protein assembly factor BamB